MTDKFTIKVQPKEEGYKPVMIDSSTHEILLQMKEHTGVSMSKLIQAAIQFAFERFEVEE